MSKCVDVEKLIAEIERLVKVNKELKSSRFTEGIAAGYGDVLSAIASLQQEQPEVDLEKEIGACWQNWLSPSNQKEVEGVLPKTEFAFYARHFYELGLKAKKEE